MSEDSQVEADKLVVVLGGEGGVGEEEGGCRDGRVKVGGPPADSERGSQFRLRAVQWRLPGLRLLALVNWRLASDDLIAWAST